MNASAWSDGKYHAFEYCPIGSVLTIGETRLRKHQIPAKNSSARYAATRLAKKWYIAYLKACLMPYRWHDTGLS